MAHLTLSPAHLADALTLIAQTHGLPACPASLLAAAAPPCTEGALPGLANLLNLTVTRASLRPAGRHPPLPALLIEKQAGAGDHRCAVLLALSPGGSALIVPPEGGAPAEIPLSALHARFCRRIYGFRPQAPAAADEDSGVAPRFGFRWFVPALWRYRRIWTDILVASVVIQLISLATPLLTQVIIDKVIPNGSTATLLVVAGALVAGVLFNALLGWLRQSLVLYTGNRIDAELSYKVFCHLIRLPQRYFDHRPTGTLIARVHGVEAIRGFLTGAAMILLLDLPAMLIFFSMMLSYHVTLSLLAAGIIVLMGLVALLISPIFRERLMRQFFLGARNTAFLTEYVSGMETVKSLQMEPLLQRRYGEYTAEYLYAGYQARQTANTYQQAMGALEQLLSVLVLCLGAWYVMQTPDFSVGMLVAFQMFASRLAAPLVRLAGLWQEFQEASLAVQRLGDIMIMPPEPAGLLTAGNTTAEAVLELQGLGFRYGERLPWLYQDLSLQITAGECLLLTGPSGSGKSTLAKLLLGFFQPQEGRILVGGRDIRTLPANLLRGYFGVVPQETTLFSGSILDNLRLGNPHATLAEIEEAARLAGIHTTIAALPDGYQTRLGERGVGLSGGQKQRLAIARALLKQPPVLIFDESTSSLDAETARDLAGTINRLKGRKTLIFITHHVPEGLLPDRVVHLGAPEAGFQGG